MRKIVMFLLVLIVSFNTASASELDNNNLDSIQPEYVGIANTKATIKMAYNTGKIHCSATLRPNLGYAISIVWKLQMTSSINSNDFFTITSWTDGGNSFTTYELDEYRYVNHGHAYRLAEDISVYSTSGSLVEHVFITSNVIHYS